MNIRQRVAVFVGLILEACLLMYPPWIIEREMDLPAKGHAAIWRVSDAIDIPRLVIEALVIALVVGAITVLLGVKRTSK